MGRIGDQQLFEGGQGLAFLTSENEDSRAIHGVALRILKKKAFDEAQFQSK